MVTTKAASTTPKPKFAVIDDVIHYTTKAGVELQLDLDFPGDSLKAAMEGDKDETEQFEIVAQLFGPDFQAAYDRMGALERTRLLRTFFVEFQKAAGIPLGESLGSSDS